MGAISALAAAAAAIPAPAQIDRAQAADAVTATCNHAASNDTDPNWRRRATTAWQFGLYGPGRNFERAQRTRHGELVTKVPIIVEGTETFVLQVPRAKLGKVGLLYGPAGWRNRLSRAATQITFEPCLHRARTGWPGGLLIKSRKATTLRVERLSGEVARIRVGRM